ncbi:MAG: hypothetical protein WCD18_20290 [Thermosynechococcaceae cyanobacterium]
MRGWLYGLGCLCILLATPVYGAEYQGQNIDGKRFPGTVYSYETGGVFEVQVEFKKKWATLYFVNGGQERVRLKRSQIANPQQIYGWSGGLLNLGGIFSIGIADDSSSNVEPPHPRPFEGLWRISLKATDLL